MSDSWKLTLSCTRAVAAQLTGDHFADALDDPQPVIVASEIDEERDHWQIDAYFDGRPSKIAIRALGRVLGVRPDRLPKPKQVENADWLTLSQAGLDPVRAGRFYVHSHNNEPDERPSVVNFCIDAGLAFGTGHHATTAGCLTALDRLGALGKRFYNIADIGTGTGLLAFAALHLWPRAHAIASDIDPVSIAVTAENAAVNGVSLGNGLGQLSLVIADGTAHPAICGNAPYDLVIANILAGPLIALAPALAQITAPGGRLILAGLLSSQRQILAGAYRRVGFQLIDSGGDGEWPVLQFRQRQRFGWRRPIRARGGAGQPTGDFGSL